MTEFEQQVRTEFALFRVDLFLRVLRTAGEPDSHRAVRDYFDELAKGVAAAIETAWDERANKAAVLAALRGT